MTIIEAIDKISENEKNSHLSENFYAKVKDEIEYLQNRLSMTKDEVVLLCAYIEIDKRGMDLCDFLGIRNTTFHMKIAAFKSMLIRRYLYIDDDSIDGIREPINSGAVINEEAMQSLLNDTPYEMMSMTGLDIYGFAAYAEQLLKNEKRKYSTYDETVNDIASLCASNPNLAISKSLANILKEDEILAFVAGLTLFINEGSTTFYPGNLSKYRDTNKPEKTFIEEIYNESSNLFKLGLICKAGNGQFKDPKMITFTDKAIDDFLPELKEKFKRSDNKSEFDQIIPYSSFKEKSLIYGEEKEQVETLFELLSEKKFAQIQERLKAENFRNGFACLFYGQPGTGKTETVFQLARKTQRDVFQINVSKVKTKWYGESESNLKRLFDDYKVYCSKFKKVPILLFNEADAIFGIRSGGEVDSATKSDCAIQNILLEEMENLEGILIATTNLTESFDSAFERRFIYKIKFNKPTLEARKSIWLTMIPKMQMADAELLAKNFDFSGGQIENIARKMTVENILKGTDDFSYAHIALACSQECISDNQDMKKIGF